MVRYSEIALKSDPVRREWEKRLVDKIKKSLNIQNVRRERGRIWVADEDCDPEKLSKVFGIQSYSPCEECKLEELVRLFTSLIDGYDSDAAEARTVLQVINVISYEIVGKSSPFDIDFSFAI